MHAGRRLFDCCVRQKYGFADNARRQSASTGASPRYRRGTLTQNGVENSVTLQLTQDYDNFNKHYTVSGPITWTGGSGTASGTFNGSLAGTTLGFRIIIPVGGFTSPPSSRFCSESLGGHAVDITGTQISGEYSGLNTCLGIDTFSGVLRLNR